MCVQGALLVAGRRSLLKAHDRQADCAMPDQSCDVHADSAGLHEIEVLPVRGPVPVSRVRIVLEASDREIVVPLADWRGRVAAVPDHVGRYPLTDRAFRGRLDEDPDVAVRVDVDEAGGDEAAGRVDRPLRGCPPDAAHPSDPRAANADVGGSRRRSRPVEDATVLDQDVEGHRVENTARSLNRLGGGVRDAFDARYSRTKVTLCPSIGFRMGPPSVRSHGLRRPRTVYSMRAFEPSP